MDEARYVGYTADGGGLIAPAGRRRPRGAHRDRIFLRRVKTQGSLLSEDAALTLLFSLVASGQIKLRRIVGWRKLGAVLGQHPAVAA